MNYYLSDADRKLLQKLLDQFRARGVSSSKPNPQLHSPEVYVAKLETGLPAMSGVVPGSGTCDLYRLVGHEAEVTLETLYHDCPVYNITSVAIAVGWAIVVRDKFGHWFPVIASSAGLPEGVCAYDILIWQPYAGTSTSPDTPAGEWVPFNPPNCGETGTDTSGARFYALGYDTWENTLVWIPFGPLTCPETTGTA